MNIKDDVVEVTVSDYEFSNLLEDLIAEIQIKNYRITRTSHIDNIHQRPELPGTKDISFRYYKIVEFCNLGSCAQLISANHLAGVFMPVRFVVYQALHTTRVSVAFLRPTAFARLFQSEPLLKEARQLEQDMTAILEEISA